MRQVKTAVWCGRVWTAMAVCVLVLSGADICLAQQGCQQSTAGGGGGRTSGGGSGTSGLGLGGAPGNSGFSGGSRGTGLGGFGFNPLAALQLARSARDFGRLGNGRQRQRGEGRVQRNRRTGAEKEARTEKNRKSSLSGKKLSREELLAARKKAHEAEKKRKKANRLASRRATTSSRSARG